MISRFGNKNFFAAHYDWLALGVGILALIGGAAFFAVTLGDDPDELAAAEAARIARLKPAETGVKSVDRTTFEQATKLTRTPVTVVDVAEKAESFLASERRVLCKCKKAISGDVKKFPACPFCGEKQEEERAVILDADGDGLPDEWEKRVGLNPHDPADAALDSDSDGFTNLEEFQAKTDPKDKDSHPDYLDSLRLSLPLKETYMPFVFTKATQIPGGWRCEFFDASQKDDYGRLGRTFTAVAGGEIGKSGFVFKGYEKKETKRERKGMKGMFVTVDVSEATVERKRDGKVLKLVLVQSKKEKPMAVDVQATLVYERGTVQNLDVVPGLEIDLNGTKYKIAEIKPAGKGAAVTIVNSANGQKRTITALE